MFSQTGIGTEEKRQEKSRPRMPYDLVIILFKMLVNYCVENGKPKKIARVIKGITVVM